MAVLIPQVLYTLDFSSDAGAEIDWELDIIGLYDPNVTPLPSWVGQGVQQLVGTGNPIEIEWERDYDVYKPIIGSSAKVNLVIETEGQYLDFNEARPYEFQVRLRYKDENNVNQDYWCGFMTSLDGREDVTTFPFTASFTATDGIGLLEQSTAPLPTSTDEANVWTAITEAIYQTGLDLEIYLDSGIRTTANPPVTLLNGTEALSQCTIDPDWIFNEARTERVTRKEGIEGILSAFNCTIKQSNGRWYVTNASTYGGTSDSVTFARYVVSGGEYVSSGTRTESLRYNIDSTENSHLVPANNDLVLNTRRPYGSVEYQPEGFYEEDIVNGGFEIVNTNTSNFSPLGWSNFPSRPALITDDEVRQAGVRSITTTQSIENANNPSDLWFTNTDGVEVDGSGTFEVSFDFLAQLNRTSGNTGVRNAHMEYQIYFMPDNPKNLGGLSDFNPLINFTVDNYVANYYVYNTEDEEWFGIDSIANIDNDDYYKTRKSVVSEGDDLGEWIHESIMMPKIRVWDYSLMDFGNTTVEGGKLYVKFYFPLGQRPEGNRKNKFAVESTTAMQVWIDNVSAKNVFANDITSPTFERVQADYTTTLTYTPAIGSGTSPALVQTINQTEFIRSGNSSDAASNLSLERIATQQKLNDYRTNFKYYEGSLINLNTVPVAPKDKVYINWSNYTETASCIINAGRFSPKKNSFEVAMYVPNQATDIAPGEGSFNDDGSINPGFFEQDVDLMPMPFPGRSNKRTYSLNVFAEVRDQRDMEIIPDGLLATPLSYQWTDVAGVVIPVEILMEPTSIVDPITGDTQRFIANSDTMMIVEDTDDTPLPQWLTNITFSMLGGLLKINAMLTIPEDSEYERLFLTGIIERFTAEVPPAFTHATINITNSGDFLKGGNAVTPYPISGVPGTVQHFTHTVAPVPNSNPMLPSEYQTFAGNFDATYANDVDLSNEDAVGGPDGISFLFSYEIPSVPVTDPITVVTVPVEITGDATDRGTVGIDLSEITVDFGTPPANVTFHEGSNTFTGFPSGTSDGYKITVIPDADYYITEILEANITYPAGVKSAGAPYRGAENWEIPIEVTYPPIEETGKTVNMVIGVSTALEPNSVTFNVRAAGVANAMLAAGDELFTQTFDKEDFGGSIASFVIDLVPFQNYSFGGVTDVEIGIGEDAVIVDGNQVVILPEDQFVVTPGYNTTTGALFFTVEGTFPDKPGQYVIGIDLIADLAVVPGGGASLNAANDGTDGRNTSAGSTITRLTPGISAAGGTAEFQVVANGDWNIMVDVGANGQTVNSTNGIFTLSQTAANGLTITVNGSITPTSGTAGTHTVILNVEEIPFASEVTGSFLNRTFSNNRPENWIVGFTASLLEGGTSNILDTAQVNQSPTYGSTSIVAPDFSRGALENLSNTTGAANLLFFG